MRFVQVQPIPLGVMFSNAVSKLKAQSSKVSFHWNLAKETFELWALSFRKWHPKWDWLYCFVLWCMCACMYPCVSLCVNCGQVSFLWVSWSVICCQDGCSTAFAKGALPEEYLKVTILTSTAWEDTRLIWYLSYSSGGAPLIPGRYVSW